MAQRVHITTVREMLKRPDPVDLVVLKKDGSIVQLNNCVGLRYDMYSGCRRVKLLNSGQIRMIRDILIMSINGMQVFL